MSNALLDRPELGYNGRATMSAAATWGRVTLQPLTDLLPEDWRKFYAYFRDRELADWNGAKPIKLPEWVFVRVMLDEERGGERFGFGMFEEHGRFIGSVELYELRPAPPAVPREATLGIMIGERALWGKGYGREALRAVLHWAFELRPDPLWIVRLRTFSHNKRAQRAFAAVGFREVGREPGKDHTDVLMRVTRDEWLALRSRETAAVAPDDADS